jgi:hypothetical protein
LLGQCGALKGMIKLTDGLAAVLIVAFNGQ